MEMFIFVKIGILKIQISQEYMTHKFILRKKIIPEPLKRAPHVRGDGIQRSYEVESNGDDSVLKVDFIYY